MKVLDIIRMGFKNIMRKKLRTSLTVISFAIGSFAIVIMISLGIGMTESYKKEIMQMGNLTTIGVNSYGYYDYDKNEYIDASNNKIDEETIRTIEGIEGVKCVSPVTHATFTIKSGKYEAWLDVQVIDFDCLKDFGFPNLEVGKDLDINKLKEGIILGGSENSLYFYNPKGRGMRYGEEPPVNVFEQSYKIFKTSYKDDKEVKDKVSLKIVGKFEETNGEYDYYHYMDIDTYYKLMNDIKDSLSKDERKRLKDREYTELKVGVENANYLESVQKEIRNLGYGTNSLNDMLGELQKEAGILELILGGIGSVSLLVAAIGIANTMIMATYERSKEIGVMKVLGCKLGDIKRMFLFEAGLIGFVGGIVGIGISYLVSWLANKYLVSMMYGYESNSKLSVIPWWLLIIALAFSFTIGMIAGYFPARKATKIKALEALRTE